MDIKTKKISQTKNKETNFKLFLLKNKEHRYSNETDEEYLLRTTHLSLDSLNIRFLKDFSFCKNLLVLYLYNNKLQTIEELHNCPKLISLNLENNEIISLSGISLCSKLQKLFLGYNCLTNISDLEGCVSLQELHVQNQKTSSPLLFDQISLQTLSISLQTLNIADNNLTSIQQISCLNFLKELDISNNNIFDIQEIYQILRSCDEIQKLTLLNNPLCKDRKYFDNIVKYSFENLITIDNKTVLETHRNFLQRKKTYHKTNEDEKEVHCSKLKSNRNDSLNPPKLDVQIVGYKISAIPKN